MTNLTGPIPTFYGGDGPEAEVRACADLLRRARPRTVQLHTWSPTRAARAVREILRPLGVDPALVLGCGVDGIARDVAQGALSVSGGVERFVDLARRARDIGALAVVWNAEASWKRPPTSTEAKRLADVIRGALLEVAEVVPEVEQHHTAYDHPTYHSTYPWRAWLGPGSPIVASWPQVYAAPGGDVMARAGGLDRRAKTALASWSAAIRAGWVTPDDPTTPVRAGVLWRPYLQAHHVPARDTIGLALRHPSAMLWAFRARSDADGRAALVALCALDRGGHWQPDGVRAYQMHAGLVADGIAGPKTLAALGAVGV